MLSQERIYECITQEKWTDALSILHKHKKEIAGDILLQQAARVVEQEYFNNLSNNSIELEEVENNLDTWYLLHNGDFYNLETDNYRKLILELVNRKPLSEASNYARIFPDEPICKLTIDKFELFKIKEEGFKLYKPKDIPMNWIEIYNRLFELINIQGDSATYYSGPRFIDTVKEFEPYFPDYNQFIDQRNSEGKSTTRKIFYYDILLGLTEEIRVKVIDRILDIVKPHEPEKVEKIEVLLGKKIPQSEDIPEVKVVKEKSKNPKVFISYSWDDEAHKDWVLHLAYRLCRDGVDVILDQYYLKPGKSLPHFVENSIERAERIIIIFTPNYKLKADKREGGVGYEYSIMNAELYNNQTTEKLIPLLKEGSKKESIPTFMQQFIHMDLRNDINFERSYLDLIREIYNEPAIQRPEIGSKPVFDKPTGVVEKPKIGLRPDVMKRVTGYINPNIVDKLRPNQATVLTLSDGIKINAGVVRVEGDYLVHYTGKGLREMFKPNMSDNEKQISENLQSKSEEYLIKNEYIKLTPLNSIVDVGR